MMHPFSSYILLWAMSGSESVEAAATAAYKYRLGDLYKKMWVWGDGLPKDPDNLGLPFSRWYPELGVIKLTYRRLGDRGPTIDGLLVKRPPNVKGAFCKVVLPAVIYAFTQHPIQADIATVREMTVTIDADPYIAACKCYVGTFLSMGFSQMKSFIGWGWTPFEDMTPERVDEYCQTDRDEIIAIVPEGQVANIPRLTPEGIDLLLSVNTTVPETPEEVGDFFREIASRERDDSSISPVGGIGRYEPL